MCPSGTLVIYSPPPPQHCSKQVSDGDVAAASNVQHLRAQLQAEVAGEDPFSGELVARNISKPFVLPEEAALAESWVV